MGQIYCITNKINGHQYVGQTARTADERYQEHLRKAKSLDLPLYRAFRKYGSENFELSILEECDNSLLNEREQFWIKELNTYNEGYNCNGGGMGGAFANFDDIQEIGDRYLKGERLDLLCKAYHHDYETVKRELEKIGIKINTNAGPMKNAKKIAALDPISHKIIKIYESQSEAGRQLCPEGNNPKAITNHISKYKNTNIVSHGFLWSD